MIYPSVVPKCKKRYAFTIFVEKSILCLIIDISILKQTHPFEIVYFAFKTMEMDGDSRGAVSVKRGFPAKWVNA